MEQVNLTNVAEDGHENLVREVIYQIIEKVKGSKSFGRIEMDIKYFKGSVVKEGPSGEKLYTLSISSSGNITKTEGEIELSEIYKLEKIAHTFYFETEIR